jgi:glycosyltransferase involved in cell wall biosynthesis
MRVTILLDFRFSITPDGGVWTSSAYYHDFWQRYLAVFDVVHIIARAQQVSEPLPCWRRVDGPRVTVSPIPYYVGPWQYLWRWRNVHNSVRRAVGLSDAVILRVSSQIAGFIAPTLVKERRPFGLEVGGDPYEAFAPGCVRSFVRPFIRLWATYQLRMLCQHAAAVAYVTRSALQRRYPCRAHATPPDLDVFTTNFASSNIREVAVDLRARPPLHKPARLIFIGSLAQLYKGLDTLLRALDHCRRRGLRLHLTVVGDGMYCSEMKELCSRLGLVDSVDFVGEVPSQSVADLLRSADLFVMPSRTEGLPRALIEAMALGIPCIGTNVGGIPELLSAEDIFQAGDVQGLASKISDVLSNSDRLTDMAARNAKVATEYTEEQLHSRRIEFYKFLHERMTEWLRDSGRVGEDIPHLVNH